MDGFRHSFKPFDDTSHHFFKWVSSLRLVAYVLSRSVRLYIGTTLFLPWLSLLCYQVNYDPASVAWM